jgi:hypothetical protein
LAASFGLIALVSACAASDAKPGGKSVAPAGAEDEPCGPGAEIYIRSGLFAWLPTGTAIGLFSTADELPLAEAGATFKIDGVDVEIWRALQYGPDEVPSAAGRVDGGATLFARSSDEPLQRCVLAGMRYDASRDTD